MIDILHTASSYPVVRTIDVGCIAQLHLNIADWHRKAERWKPIAVSLALLRHILTIVIIFEINILVSQSSFHVQLAKVTTIDNERRRHAFLYAVSYIVGKSAWYDGVDGVTIGERILATYRQVTTQKWIRYNHFGSYQAVVL